jgi:hypothetical protein
MTTTFEPTASEQVDIQVQPQQITEESDPTRKAISEAVEQSYKNLEILIEKWDLDKIESLEDLMEEVASSRKGLEEVAELIKHRMHTA